MPLSYASIVPLRAAFPRSDFPACFPDCHLAFLAPWYHAIYQSEGLETKNASPQFLRRLRVRAVPSTGEVVSGPGQTCSLHYPSLLSSALLLDGLSLRWSATQDLASSVTSHRHRRSIHRGTNLPDATSRSWARLFPGLSPTVVGAVTLLLVACLIKRVLTVAASRT
jgi:hypothetical protein